MERLAFPRTVDASFRGEDYPEGYLARTDPLERRFPLSAVQSSVAGKN
jgi:hypothetical protein